jgi:hypothetical protein
MSRSRKTKEGKLDRWPLFSAVRARVAAIVDLTRTEEQYRQLGLHKTANALRAAVDTAIDDAADDSINLVQSAIAEHANKLAEAAEAEEDAAAKEEERWGNDPRSAEGLPA